MFCTVNKAFFYLDIYLIFSDTSCLIQNFRGLNDTLFLKIFNNQVFFLNIIFSIDIRKIDICCILVAQIQLF